MTENCASLKYTNASIILKVNENKNKKIFLSLQRNSLIVQYSYNLSNRLEESPGVVSWLTKILAN